MAGGFVLPHVSPFRATVSRTQMLLGLR